MAYQLNRSSLWYVTVREPLTGRTKRLSAETEAEADALALEYRAAKKRGDKKVKPVPVGEGNAFGGLALAHLSRLKPDTARNELYYLNDIYSPLIGHKPVAAITADDLKAIVSELGRRGLKQNTVKRRMSFVKAVLNRAARDGLIDSVPTVAVAAGTDAVIIPPTQAEVDRLILASAEHLARAIILCIFTGLRPGKSELLALTWDCVDLDDKVIRVESAKKGGLPWREVPISSALFSHVHRWHDADDGEGYIVHYRGKQVGDIKKAWAAAKERAGIKRRLRMYDLRHAFVTGLVSAGVDISTAAYLAGHASPATTAKVYRHVTEKDTRAAVEKLLDTSARHKPRKTAVAGHKFKQ